MVHTFTCTGLTETQYHSFAEAAGIGFVIDKTIDTSICDFNLYMYTVVHYLHFSYDVIFPVLLCVIDYHIYPYDQLVFRLNLAFTLQLIELYHFVSQSIKTRDLGICL